MRRATGLHRPLPPLTSSKIFTLLSFPWKESFGSALVYHELQKLCLYMCQITPPPQFHPIRITQPGMIEGLCHNHVLPELANSVPLHGASMRKGGGMLSSYPPPPRPPPPCIMYVYMTYMTGTASKNTLFPFPLQKPSPLPSNPSSGCPF